MVFDISKAVAKAEPSASESNKATPVAITPLKLTLSTPSAIKPSEAKPVATPVATPTLISGADLLAGLPEPMSYKDKLSEIPSLDELAEEFQNSEQPEDFDDAALAAIHKACLKLEESIDNAEDVRSQLTFIMTELRKYPETAAKIYDEDMHRMVKALRANYNVVAFAKAANKAKKETKAKKSEQLLAELDATGLFDGLQF